MPSVLKIGFWIFCFLLFAGFLAMFSEILTPFILGIIIAYLLDPVMRKLSRKQIPRWVTALTILTLFCAFILLIVAIITPMALRQGQMLIDELPNYLQAVMNYVKPYLSWFERKTGTDYMEQLTASLKDNAGSLVGVTGGLAAGLASGGKFLAEFATTLVLTPLVAFFMMKEWPYICRWIESLYPRQHATLIHGLLNKIDIKVAGFIRGQISVAFMLGVIYAIALTIAGLNYGFLIGIGAGIFSIIPLVGSTLGLVVGIVVAWFQTGDTTYTVIIAAIFMAGQFIEGNFLAPKVVGDSVGLHPLWIMFALLAGGSLLGITGMLIAVPAAAVVGVLSGFAIDRYKASSLYQKDPDTTAIILETSLDE